MCPYDEQKLEQLFAKPMPIIEADGFLQRTLKKAKKANQRRLLILQVFFALGFVSLFWFLPFANVGQAIAQFDILRLSSIQILMNSAMPIFMLILVGYFIKDELY